MLEKPFLYGESIVLRPISIEDAETIFVSLFDREVMRFTGTHQTLKANSY